MKLPWMTSNKYGQNIQPELMGIDSHVKVGYHSSHVLTVQIVVRTVHVAYTPEQG